MHNEYLLASMIKTGINIIITIKNNCTSCDEKISEFDQIELSVSGVK